MNLRVNTFGLTLGLAVLAVACNDGTPDPGETNGSSVGGSSGVGGASSGTGGSTTPSVGGQISTGGTSSTGGAQVTATGGANTGGQATGTGGSATGGAPTGGKATGGANTGGQAAGGKAAGGAATGGNANGGASTGGIAAGGKSGDPTGGKANGGAAVGGSPSGGASGGTSVAGAGAAVPSSGCGKTPTLKNGTITITSASLSRQYIIDIPSDYNNNHPYRLVFGFHWMGGTMTDVATGQTVTRNVWSYFGLKQLDTPRSAIFVAPQGIDNGWANTNGRDLALTDDMVKQITEDLCIDKSRIFSGGFSYGGMWSSTLACQRPDVFRAVAPQNGAGSCANAKPMAFFGSGSNDGTNTSLLNYARVFAKANGCANPNQDIPIPVKGSLLHTCTSFTGCPANYPVRFCAFDQNHKAAPYDGGCAECDDGNKTWTPKEVWGFYTQF